VDDVYNGVTVVSLPHDVQSGALLLSNNLKRWKEAGKRGVWLKIALSQSEYVPIAAKLGFVFHHAQKDYVMMTNWLPDSEPNTLPNFADHYIGVGGAVVNDRGELLVVKERYHSTPFWKLPGGLAETGENLGEAAVREVFEETGVRATFTSVLCFRHRSDAPFQRGDIYFVVRLKPQSEQINIDPREILECKWMPLEEFTKHPEVLSFNRKIGIVVMRLHQQLSAKGATTKSGSSPIGGGDECVVEIQAHQVTSFDGIRKHLMYSAFPYPED